MTSTQHAPDEDAAASPNADPSAETTISTAPVQAPAQKPYIVVGVDGSQGSKIALRWAMDEARLAGVGVEAVTAWQDPIRAGYGFAYGWSAGPGLMDDGQMHSAAEKTLDAAITEVSGMQVSNTEVSGTRVAGTQDRPVEVRARVVQGHPAEVLLAAAADARLLVVGTRGHNSFAGMLLGSVSQHCIQHAPCPVVVVPSAVGTGSNPSTTPDDPWSQS